MVFTKFSPTDMRLVLKDMFSAVGERTNKAMMPEPLYYESPHAIIFPPATDRKDADESMLCSITEMMSIAQKELSDKITGKILLIPVAEENPQFSRMTEPVNQLLPAIARNLVYWSANTIPTPLSAPRNHWVTLHYDPNSRIATLIDSRPQALSWGYQTAHIEGQFLVALKGLGLEVVSFEVQYQAVQHDTKHCGDWTLHNIEQLSTGRPLDHALEDIDSSSLDTIVSTHRERYKKQIALKKTNSDESITTVADEEDSDDLEFFTPANSPELFSFKVPDEHLQAWKNKALNSFRAHMGNEQKIADAIIARESVMLNGQKLSQVLLKNVSIFIVLEYIESVYKSVIITEQQDRIRAGFSLNDPTRLYSRLVHIGIDNVQTLPLSLVIQLDAALYIALAESGLHEYFCDEFLKYDASSSSESDGQEEQKLSIVKQTYDNIFAELEMVLKEEIQTLISEGRLSRFRSTQGTEFAAAVDEVDVLRDNFGIVEESASSIDDTDEEFTEDESDSEPNSDFSPEVRPSIKKPKTTHVEESDTTHQYTEEINPQTDMYPPFYLLAISSSLLLAGIVVITASFIMASCPVGVTLAGMGCASLGVMGLTTYGLFKLTSTKMPLEASINHPLTT